MFNQFKISSSSFILFVLSIKSSANTNIFVLFLFYYKHILLITLNKLAIIRYLVVHHFWFRTIQTCPCLFSHNFLSFHICLTLFIIPPFISNLLKHSHILFQVILANAFSQSINATNRSLTNSQLLSINCLKGKIKSIATLSYLKAYFSSYNLLRHNLIKDTNELKQHTET